VKAELWYEEHKWEFHVTAESEMDKCALRYLYERPKNNFRGVNIEHIPWWFVPEQEVKSESNN
jgi:hypothetical protein